MFFMIKHVLIFTFSLCIIAEAFSQGSLFIIGGGKRPPELLQRLVQEAKVQEKGYIVILPMASAEQDSAIYFASQQFVKMGISRVTGFMMTKGERLAASVIDSIANAQLIYISGGDQSRLMDIIGGTDVQRAIEMCYARGNVIAGTSAGAAVMSQKMITGVELKYPNTTEGTESRGGFETIEAGNIELTSGLGFLKNAIIDQHFVKRKRQNRLMAVAIENPGMLCVGIDEATAILVKNGVAEVIGDSQVVVVVNSKKNRKDYKGKLGATGMRLDLLVPGDTFKIF